MISTVYSKCKHYWVKAKEPENPEYDYVAYSPPQLPPARINTQNNPAYVFVELTDCVAYESGLQVRDSSSPQATHQGEDEQREQQGDTDFSVANETCESDEYI